MEAVEELSELAESMRQAAPFLADDDPSDDDAPLHHLRQHRRPRQRHVATPTPQGARWWPRWDPVEARGRCSSGIQVIRQAAGRRGGRGREQQAGRPSLSFLTGNNIDISSPPAALASLVSNLRSGARPSPPHPAATSITSNNMLEKNGLKPPGFRKTGTTIGGLVVQRTPTRRHERTACSGVARSKQARLTAVTQAGAAGGGGASTGAARGEDLWRRLGTSCAEVGWATPPRRSHSSPPVAPLPDASRQWRSSTPVCCTRQSAASPTGLCIASVAARVLCLT